MAALASKKGQKNQKDKQIKSTSFYQQAESVQH